MGGIILARRCCRKRRGSFEFTNKARPHRSMIGRSMPEFADMEKKPIPNIVKLVNLAEIPPLAQQALSPPAILRKT